MRTIHASLLICLIVASAAPARAQEAIAMLTERRAVQLPGRELEPGVPPTVADDADRLAAPRETPPAPALAHVRLLADRPGITFSLGRSLMRDINLVGHGVTRRRYETLCTAPCEVTRTPGTATLRLDAGGGDSQTVGAVTVGAGDTTLVAHYESRAELRTGLWVGGASLMAGGVAALIGCLQPGIDGGLATGLAVTSTILLVLGLVVAALVELAQDEAHVDAAGDGSITRQ